MAYGILSFWTRDPTHSAHRRGELLTPGPRAAPAPPQMQSLSPTAPLKAEKQTQFEQSATLFQSRNKSFPNNKYKKIIN